MMSRFFILVILLLLSKSTQHSTNTKDRYSATGKRGFLMNKRTLHY